MEPNKCFLLIRCAESPIKGNRTNRLTARIILRNLILFGVALVFSMGVAPESRALDQPDTGSYKNLDARWLPWIGSWQMVSVNATENTVKDQYLFTISPSGDSGNSITMKGFHDEKVLSRETIITDGMRHPLTNDKCTGWYTYSWSETGKRLLLKSESNCQGELQRLISGMSIIDDTGEWVDIQLLQNGKGKAVTIRRYRNVDNASVGPGGINEATPAFARSSAGSNFSISEIIELSAKVEPEVLEAALLELRKPFPINSKQLEHLADSKIPSEIIDLMVALSFPDDFTVERMTISPVQRPIDLVMGYPVDTDVCWDDDYPFFPWHWRPFIDSPCDYWYMGWDAGFGWYYPYRWHTYFGGEGHGIDIGRLVEGRGYTRVQPNVPGSHRYAQPRTAPAGQGKTVQPASSSNSEISTSGSSSGSSTGSSSKSPCASPSGYSAGNCD